MNLPPLRSLALALVLGLALASCSSDPAFVKQKYLQLGNEQFDQKHYAEAIIDYRKALQQDPLFGEARFKLAQAYDKLGDAANATGEYVRAADLLPMNSEAQIKAGMFLVAG